MKNAALLGGGTLAAAVFGLVFQSLLAYHFGAGAETDAWFMSLSIYAFLAKFLMLTHLKSIALPIYRRLSASDPDQGRRFGALLLGWSGGALVAAAAVLVLAAPLLVDALAPGYQGAVRDLTVDLVRIRVPALVFLGTTTAGLVLLESAHRFGVTVSSQKIVPAVVTLVLFVLVADRYGMVGVGWIGLAGGVAGGLVALAAVAPLVAGRRGARGTADAELRGVAGQWLKFGGSNAATFVGEWAFRIAASLLPVGLFSAVLYGRMVHDLLHGAVNDAAQSVSLPRFAEVGEHGDEARVGAALRASLAALSALTVPVAAFVAATAPWSVALLFGRGRFLDDGMVGPAAVALQIYAVGFVLQGLNQLVFAAAFSVGQSHLVNRVQIVGHLVRAALLVPAVMLYSYAGLVGAQVAMNALVLLLLVVAAPRAWALRGAAVRVVAGPTLGVVLATLAPAALWWMAVGRLPEPVAWGTAGRFGVLAAAGAVWGVLYLGLATAFRVPAARDLLARLRSVGGGAALLLLGLLAGPGAGSAQEVADGPLPAEHWSRAVLESLEAAGRVPMGSVRAGPLDGARAEALLLAADDPRARAALWRLRDEAAVEGRTVPLAGTVGVAWRHVRDGTEGAVGASGLHAAGDLRLGRPGGVWFATARLDAGRGGVEVPRGAVGVRMGRFTLGVGRHRVQLGGGAGGAFALSPSAGLDGVLLAPRSPVPLPVVGATSVTAGLFRAGRYDDVVEDPWFALLRVAVRPVPWLMAGVSRAALVGGDFQGGRPPFQTEVHPPDARPMGAGDVLDLLIGRVTEYDNQVWAFDVRGSLAGAGVPAVLYGEIALEDNERSFGDGAALAGVLVDAPAGRSMVSVRYEYAGIGDAGRWCRWCDTLPAFWYQHTRFQDGWRVGDELLGHPLGGYGRQHVLAVGIMDPTGALRGTVAGVRLRRDRWNLREGSRPGRAWGLRSSVAWRPGRRFEAGLETDLEWGEGGWRAGTLALSFRAVPGGNRTPPG
ncbi:MAG: lipid II flippase MurJ [Longimicrobiales bacterium]